MKIILGLLCVFFPLAFAYVLISRMQAKRARRKYDPKTKLPFWWVPPFVFFEWRQNQYEEDIALDYKVKFGDGGMETDFNDDEGGFDGVYEPGP